MYNFTKWDVLIVDDEPDVLALSKLVMADYDVYGLPLVLHTVPTKADAIEFLHRDDDLATNLALAFIDVVMETDSAGLELCNYIREDIGNRLTQIFIRTGQPGTAPEREVINQYEINGYFTKVDATEEKLYSLVKSGVRQFLWSHMAQFYMSGTNEILRSTHWRPKIKQLLVSFIESAPGMPLDIPIYIAIDNKVLIQQGIEEQQAIQWKEKIQQLDSLRFTTEGNLYARDEENLWGIHIVQGVTNAELLLLCRTTFAPPEDLVAMTHDFFQSISALWMHAI
ncbi:MAG: response regulator receiver protein [Chloroflexota bacterium]